LQTYYGTFGEAFCVAYENGVGETHQHLLRMGARLILGDIKYGRSGTKALRFVPREGVLIGSCHSKVRDIFAHASDDHLTKHNRSSVMRAVAMQERGDIDNTNPIEQLAAPLLSELDPIQSARELEALMRLLALTKIRPIAADEIVAMLVGDNGWESVAKRLGVHDEEWFVHDLALLRGQCTTQQARAS